MPTSGTPAFDAIAIVEVTGIDFTDKATALVAHGAFINTKTGATYGKTTCQRWSKGTLAKLEELRVLMEQDMAAMVFESDQTAAGPLQSWEPTGIGEHAKAPGDAASI